jgi:hypothetical protein
MRNIHADPYVLVVGADNVVHEKLIRLGGQKGDAWSSPRASIRATAWWPAASSGSTKARRSSHRP